MIRKIFFTKRSVLFILLASNAFNPLLALPHEPYSIVKNNLQISSIKIDVRNLLINKGLDRDVAISKTNKLFDSSKYTSNTLSRLYNYPELFTSKDKLNNALAKYALFEKNLDLSSYNSLISLAQSISLQPLSKKHLNTVRNLASTY